MKIFILDDEVSRVRKLIGTPSAKTVTWARTAREAIAILGNKNFDVIMLDHDLAVEHYEAFDSGSEPGGPPTGYEVAKWIARNADSFREVKIVIHSLNAPAAERMVGVLGDVGIQATHVPFAWTKI